MPSNKDRLYVALYARGGEVKMPGLEDKYHWAFMIGSKTETPSIKGLLCQVKNGIGSQPDWYYEDRDVCMKPTPRLLVRVIVGKIKSRERLEAILRDTPIRAQTAGWNCVEWIKEALESVGRDDKALGRAVTKWQSVRDQSMRYVDEKRHAGRFGRDYDSEKTPTWDLLEGEELIP